MKLQSIQLDFAPSRFIGSQRSGLLLFAGIVILLLAGASYQYTTTLESEAAARQAALEKKLGLVPAASRSSGRNNPSLAATITAEVNRPWARLFMDLEDSLGAGISLLRVEPNPKGQEVLLVGVGVRMEDIAGFIQRLNQTTSLRNARMTTQRTLDNPSDGQLEFTIVANWTEAK